MKNAVKVIIFTLAVIVACALGVYTYISYLNPDFEVAKGTKTNTVEIIGYYGDDSQVKIPKKYRGKTITSIGENAFNSTDITSVEIPNTVVSVGEDAFSSCKNLETVELPNSIKKIGEYAFANCSKLQNINLPSSLESIGQGAFLLCNSLTSIDVDKDASFVFTNGVLYDSKYETVYWVSTKADMNGFEFPNTVKEYNGYAFAYNNDIKSFEFPQGTKTIKSSVLLGCKSLTQVKIPDGVQTIQSAAFLGCDSLKSIFIPASVIKIEDLAFPGMGTAPEEKSSDFTLMVVENSIAHEYAKKYNLNFEIIK